MFRRRRIHHHLALLAAMSAFLARADPLLAQQESPPPQDETTPSADASWAPLKLLEGQWEGEIDGKLGRGKGLRRYELIMGGQFLVCHHQSVRLPQEKSPKGDQHEELGVFSFDSQRRKIVFREFLSEGVVVLSTCAVEGMKVVCTSESVESGPGIRARLTLEIVDRYRFTEMYELAFPGKDLELYFSNRWTRTPPRP